MGKSESRRSTVVVITGPTGSGKTELALRIAREFGCPIISADSRQIYRGMAIGTAQPTAEQLSAVRHYFIATHNPEQDYDAGTYEKNAISLINNLFETHDTLVVAGGSGLYIDALCYGMDEFPDTDPALREKLMEKKRAEGLEGLVAELAELDPAHYRIVDRNNPQRVIRALEVCYQTGRPYSEARSGRRAKRDFDIVKIGTSVPRETLYGRINRRVDEMMENGLEDEAKALYTYRDLNSLQTVGYRELFEYFDGEITREEAVELIKRNSRRYAKRQMTWLRRHDDIEWFDPLQPDIVIDYLRNKLHKT